MIIGKNRLEGIDWIQDELSVARPLAERTYFALLDAGLLEEGVSDIEIAKAMHGDNMREFAAQTDVISQNNQQRARVSRRSHSPTQKRGRYTTLKQGNTIDCATDEIYQ